MPIMEVKLKDHHYANCRVIMHIGYNRDGIINKLQLISYATVVAELNVYSEYVELVGYGRFSATTCNHIRWFGQQFTGTNLYPYCKIGTVERPFVTKLSSRARAKVQEEIAREILDDIEFWKG